MHSFSARGKACIMGPGAWGAEQWKELSRFGLGPERGHRACKERQRSEWRARRLHSMKAEKGETSNVG